MGTAHLQPHGTRGRWNEIAEYKRQHICVTQRSDDRIEEELREDTVIEAMCNEYGFTKIRDGGEWIHNGTGVDEKVIAETRHGVELRVKYHPQGSKYYFLVAVTGEFNEENLAVKHLNTYKETLRELLDDVYGEVRRKSSRWTSQPIEV
jgi:hypothetical protein